MKSHTATIVDRKAVDIAWIASTVSKAATALHPPRKVAYMVDGTTAVMEPCTANNENRNILESFWPPDCGLSPFKQRDFYWQYHRSSNCQNYALFLARTLQEVLESGLALEYHNCLVTDVWVFNSVEFEVSDVLNRPDQVLNLHDPTSGMTVPVISTYQTMDRLHEAGAEICARFGYGVQVVGDAEKNFRNTLKQHRPESYTGSFPHWWIAVKTKQPDSSTNLVHIDICGAAYDPDKGFMETDGFSDEEEEPQNHLPLLIFETPEYELKPNVDLQHKFFVLPNLNNCLPGTTLHPVSLQPKSVRHFRCYHRNDNSMLEVTPLGTFIDRLTSFSGPEMNGLVQRIRDDTVLFLAEEGDTVVIHNVKSQKSLNGQVGVVTDQVLDAKMSNGRIPVRLPNQKVVALKPECIKFQIRRNNNNNNNNSNNGSDDNKPSYSTLKDMKKQSKAKLPKNPPKEPNLSNRERAEIQRLMDTNPCVMRALAEMQSNKLTFTGFADPEIRRGIELLLKPPLCVILPMEVRAQYRSALDMIDHPSGPEAVKIIKMLKAAKQRIAEERPDLIDSMGSVALVPGSDLDRLQKSIVAKIRGDPGLAHVFDRLEECGMYMNPARLR